MRPCSTSNLQIQKIVVLEQICSVINITKINKQIYFGLFTLDQKDEIKPNSRYRPDIWPWVEVKPYLQSRYYLPELGRKQWGAGGGPLGCGSAQSSSSEQPPPVSSQHSLEEFQLSFTILWSAKFSLQWPFVKKLFMSPSIPGWRSPPGTAAAHPPPEGEYIIVSMYFASLLWQTGSNMSFIILLGYNYFRRNV